MLLDWTVGITEQSPADSWINNVRIPSPKETLQCCHIVFFHMRWIFVISGGDMAYMFSLQKLTNNAGVRCCDERLESLRS